MLKHLIIRYSKGNDRTSGLLSFWPLSFVIETKTHKTLAVMQGLHHSKKNLENRLTQKEK